MTDRLINLLLIKLKVLGIMLVLALASLFLFSFSRSQQMADDIWKQLGMTREQGTDGVKQSFMNGYLYYYAAKNARNIASNNRAALAKDLLQYTKQYMNSDIFKKFYENERKSAMPQPLTTKAKSKEDIRREKIAEVEKSIRETEKAIKEGNADMAKIFKPGLDIMNQNLKDYKDQNSKVIDLFYQGELYDQADRERSYKEDMVRWEKNFPADYRLIIKDRLQKYLQVAATVDFSAELKQVGNKKKFLNPGYEGKSYDWKQIYRAGKEVYDVAKPFAESWLKEISN